MKLRLALLCLGFVSFLLIEAWLAWERWKRVRG